MPVSDRIRIERGNITRLAVDAMVNAANSSLAGGGGVDGAIHQAGGPSLMKELDIIRAQRGGCPTGSAVVTGAGNLPARFVFHAVGPVWGRDPVKEAEQLAGCYRTCLELAVQHGVRTISFPAISTGVYGYPAEQAAQIAVREVTAFLEKSSQIEQVLFVVFSPDAERIYRRLLDRTD